MFGNGCRFEGAAARHWGEHEASSRWNSGRRPCRGLCRKPESRGTRARPGPRSACAAATRPSGRGDPGGTASRFTQGKEKARRRGRSGSNCTVIRVRMP